MQLVNLKLVGTIRAETWLMMIRKSYCLFLAFNPVMIEYIELYSVLRAFSVIILFTPAAKLLVDYFHKKIGCNIDSL